MSMNMKRRSFLKSTLLAAPFIGGCGTFGGGYAAPRRPPANGRLNLAVIGCGTMGAGNMQGFLADPRVRVAVVCDPVFACPTYGYDAKTPGGRKPFKETVDKRYGNTDCRMVADWREVVADPTVDAVLVSTTDHWHALISVAAMKAGKHVYCQKPMTLGVSEGKVMVEAAKRSGVVFQVGSQQRSASEFRVACELFMNGYLGDCTTCTIGLTYPHNDSRGNHHARNAARTAAPAYFDPKGMWDMWQGPAAHWEDNAFIPGIHEPLAWRWNWRTGSGTIADWGAHHLDILQWALGKDRSGPVAIENFSCDFQPPNALVAPDVFSTPYHFSFDVVYDNGFRARVCDTSKAKQGLTFHAAKGDLFVTRGKLERPKHLRKWNEKRDLKDGDVRLYRNAKAHSHEMDFVDGIFDGTPTATDCEIGHRSITIAHLANACARLGLKGLKWDPAVERVVGPNAAAVEKDLVVRHHNGWKLEA